MRLLNTRIRAILGRNVSVWKYVMKLMLEALTQKNKTGYLVEGDRKDRLFFHLSV